MSIPRDMDSEGGTVELVGEEHGAPVFRYRRMDGEEATVRLRTMPIGERNAGDELLLETDEVDARGNRVWRQAIVRP